MVATFNGRRAVTCRKHVSEQNIIIPNWSKIIQRFWSHSSVFALEKQPISLNCLSFLTTNRPFCGYFPWNACSHFQKIYSWTRDSDAKLMKTISNFWWCFSIFALEKQAKNLNFQSLLTSNRRFHDYVQWNYSTDFQKIRSCTRYSDAEFIEKHLKVFGGTPSFFP